MVVPVIDVVIVVLALEETEDSRAAIRNTFRDELDFLLCYSWVFPRPLVNGECMTWNCDDDGHTPIERGGEEI